MRNSVVPPGAKPNRGADPPLRRDLERAWGTAGPRRGPIREYLTAVFSVVNAVLLKPLSIPDPDRLVVLLTSDPSTGEETEYWYASPARFVFWQAQSSVLQYVSAFRSVFVNYTGGETA